MSKTLVVSFTPRDGSYTRELVEHFKTKVAGKTELNETNLVEVQPSLMPVADDGVFFDQVAAADYVVLAYPIWNFDAPAAIKAWIDQVWIPGKAFKKDEDGTHHGLLSGRKLLLISAAGGNTAADKNNYATPMIDAIFAYAGITDVQHVMASGFLRPDKNADELLSAGRAEISKVVDNWYN